MSDTPMSAARLLALAADYVAQQPEAVISAQAAISRAEIGLQLFDTPLIGFAAADDPLFAALTAPEAVGPQIILPAAWLPGARTVISVCLPFSAAVRESNRRHAEEPSPGWLHARYEGQAFINQLCGYLAGELIAAGYQAVAPSLDPRFKSWSFSHEIVEYGYNSNWSERHAAFIAGLGSFGLSAGLITAKGMAARFCSLITDAGFAPTAREYTDIYEYCNRCGACARACPAAAISLEQGKDHALCSQFVNATLKKYYPRYGCGKCQVGVPCASGIPPGKRG